MFRFQFERQKPGRAGRVDIAIRMTVVSPCYDPIINWIVIGGLDPAIHHLLMRLDVRVEARA
jgi:hypothetical protein